jgi:hypothetical protein
MMSAAANVPPVSSATLRSIFRVSVAMREWSSRIKSRELGVND